MIKPLSLHKYLDPKPPCTYADASLCDVIHDPALKAAAAVVSVDGARKATGQVRQGAAAAQQLRTLHAVAAPRLQGARYREPELRLRLCVMRARAAGAEDVASGGGVRRKR